MSIPNDAFLILIGAMKAGTSTVFGHLARHPRIAPSRVKEPEYFSEGQGHGAEVDCYDDLWTFDPGQHQYCVEASTGYTKYPHELHVPDRMLEAGVEPRFIYSVRNPIDRMESQFNHGRMRQSDWAYEDFLEPALINISRYYMQLQQYLLRFPSTERYYILDFDELIKRPQAAMDSIFEWLELKPVTLPSAFHANKTPDLSWLELVLADIDFSTPLRVIPTAVKARLRGLARSLVPARRRMSETERVRMRSYLERDIRFFGKEFDFPVRQWGF